MKTFALLLTPSKSKTFLVDFLSLAAIAFIPALSHMLSIPIYIFEPMRILLVLSLVHTSKKNAYLIAVLLPLFSFLISAHPSVVKSMLITTELLLNLFLFFLAVRYINNNFAAAFASILVSKIYYYAAKFGLASAGFIGGKLIATPFYLQLIIAGAVSTYVYFFYKNAE
ncbi:MAG: hypothetical protein HYS25_07400 [Ignavibacteriales bacterium]|nr:hypothetical protein [Ignavibacteriales bacterium]